MSGDLEQDYFSDGITEDIIAELGKFREFLVIARASSFQFRGKANDVGRGGEEAWRPPVGPDGEKCSSRNHQIPVLPVKCAGFGLAWIGGRVFLGYGAHALTRAG